MKISFLMFTLLWLASLACVGQERNLRNLRFLLKDTSLYSNIAKGIFDHPALEIGAKKEFKEISHKNYPIRIAIDPGHVASNRREAAIEERYINSKHGFFYESELNMATALALKQMLETRGFEVMLTRNPKETACGMSYLKWYKKKFKQDILADLRRGRISVDRYQTLLKASPKDVFHKYFKDKEFISREEKINAFAPDIALIIHYNASEFVNSASNYSPEVAYNYSVYFVPGGFTNAELKQQTHLEDFIRLASTDNIQKSIQLSSFIATEFEAKLGAPLLKPDDIPELWYLDKYSVYAGTPGIYSRNLFMTRTIISPVCYGECLLQNNAEEIRMLSKREYLIGPYKVSWRVKDVANCYYAGVIRYFQYLGKIK